MIPASSEATGTDRYSWRKPGRWRLAYAALWLAAAVLYFLAFGRVMTLQDVPLVLVLSLFPAVGFLLIRSKSWLWVVALLGLPIAGFLLLVAGMSDYGVSLSEVSQAAQLGLVIALLAALLASMTAIVVLPRPKWVDEVIGGLGGF